MSKKWVYLFSELDQAEAHAGGWEGARGLIELTDNPRFVWDAHRRLVQMFGSVVMDVPDELFEAVITARRKQADATSDAELGPGDWEHVTYRFKEIVRAYAGRDFPDQPVQQLRMAIEAVFESWNGKRAIDYRNAAGIGHDLGTAVNIVTMVFGNMGATSATGVAMSRNAATGENELEGDYLVNAQGEDDGKRTAQAEVRIAVDMVEEGLIAPREAVQRVQPGQVDFFLHPQLDPVARKQATCIARGLDVSPGAAVGAVAFDADTAERWARAERRPVIMVRPETRPDDVHGMLAARGVVTSRGGRTSHAALVARQFGKPAVVGVSEIEIDLETREMRVGDRVIKEGEPISIDGTLGEIYLGELPTVVPDMSDPHLTRLLAWADQLLPLQRDDFAGLREQNPMLGTRGVRLGILIPELPRMQVRAIFEAACQCKRSGVKVRPEVMIPLVAHVKELEVQRRTLEEVARQVMKEQGVEVEYMFGTMIELPRAAPTADELARLAEYARRGILADNPFATIDENGVATNPPGREPDGPPHAAWRYTA